MTTGLGAFVQPLPVSLLVQPVINIVSAVDGTPTVIETETPHYFVTGDGVTIVDVAPPTGATYAGVHIATVIDATHFSIPESGGSTSTAMTVQRTTPVEPLTIDEGKLRAGLDWAPGDPRDALMAGFIAAARSQVEQDTGLALLPQVRDIYWTEQPSQSYWWAVMPPSLALLPSQSFPLQAVISATLAADGVTTITRIASGFASIAALPPLLVHAIGLLTAHYATAARDLVITGTIVNTTPMGYAEAIAPYTLVTQI